tara:strand:- start:62 stop:484 length:423 start_codon:yes stop_codon:yes gene_type:complete
MKSIIEKFKNNLQQENLKCTPQRLAILEQMMNLDDHLEVDEILVMLKDNGVEVSRATLYRTIEILVKYHFIRKLDIGDGRIRYEKKIGTSHHDHMICVDTGDIIEFCNDEIERIQNTIADQHGYEIIRHVHQLFVRKKTS